MKKNTKKIFLMLKILLVISVLFLVSIIPLISAFEIKKPSENITFGYNLEKSDITGCDFQVTFGEFTSN